MPCRSPLELCTKIDGLCQVLLSSRTPPVFLWKNKTILLVDRPDAPKDSESVAFLQTRRAIDLSRSSTCKIRTTLGEERTLNFTINFLASCGKT